MPDASWFQNDFSGGEISPDAQGNFDDPMYGKSLVLCRNNLVLPSKSVERRQGTRILGSVDPSRDRIVRALVSNNSTPLIAEFEELSYNYLNGSTQGGMHLWAPADTFGASLPAFANDVIRSPLSPVCDGYAVVRSISSDSPAVFTLATPVAWTTNDRVTVYVDDPNPATCSRLRASTFLVTVLTTTTFTLSAVRGGNGASVNGSTLVNRTSFAAMYIGHHWNVRGPSPSAYAAYDSSLSTAGGLFGVEVEEITFAQAADNRAFFFFPKVMPWVLDFSNPAAPTFTDANWNWSDGPWEDPPPGNSQTGNFGLAITANTGATITLEYDGVHTIPEIRGIAQGIRLWTQPAAWSAAGAYTPGQVVTYNDEFYTNTVADTGTYPGSANAATGAFPWLLSPTLGTWSNGFLVSKTATTMTFQIVSAQQVPAYSPANTIETYQAAFYFTANLVVGSENFFNGRGPSCGAWHEGRLWLAGSGADLALSYPPALGSPTQYGYNRFDTSMANQTIYVGGSIPSLGTSVSVISIPQFSPTDNNGNVLDSCGISYTLNAVSAETIHWLQPDFTGVLAGTNTSEWLITASSLNDPITPTSIQAHRQTTFGSSPIQPVVPGLAVLFVQQNERRVVEYVADVLSQRFTGQPLNERALHLSGNPSVRQSPAIVLWEPAGIIEINYMPEPYPMVWLVMADGSLACCLYRRLSRFGQEAPVLNAWSSHVLGGAGGGRYVNSCTVIRPIPGIVITQCSAAAIQSLQPPTTMLILATESQITGTGFPSDPPSAAVEMMMPPYGPNGTAGAAWFLDGAVSGGIDGVAAVQDVTSGITSTTFYGLGEQIGAVLSVYAGGQYVGDYTVANNGTLTVIGTSLATLSTWADTTTIDGDWWTFSSMQIFNSVNGVLFTSSYYAPVVIGYKYSSAGQLMRPNSAQDAKTPTGPAVAKQRRFNMIGAQVQNTVELNVGVGSDPYAAVLSSDITGTALLSQQFVYNLGTMQAVPIVYPNGSSYSGNLDFPASVNARPLQYNGILWTPVNDTYSFDGMIAWQISDPYPCRILSLGGFFQTQER